MNQNRLGGGGVLTLKNRLFLPLWIILLVVLCPLFHHGVLIALIETKNRKSRAKAPDVNTRLSRLSIRTKTDECGGGISSAIHRSVRELRRADQSALRNALARQFKANGPFFSDLWGHFCPSNVNPPKLRVGESKPPKKREPANTFFSPRKELSKPPNWRKTAQSGNTGAVRSVCVRFFLCAALVGSLASCAYYPRIRLRSLHSSETCSASTTPRLPSYLGLRRFLTFV